jgi:hypothetical protein
MRDDYWSITTRHTLPPFDSQPSLDHSLSCPICSSKCLSDSTLDLLSSYHPHSCSQALHSNRSVAVTSSSHCPVFKSASGATLKHRLHISGMSAADSREEVSKKRRDIAHTADDLDPLESLTSSSCSRPSDCKRVKVTAYTSPSYQQQSLQELKHLFASKADDSLYDALSCTL